MRIDRPVAWGRLAEGNILVRGYGKTRFAWKILGFVHWKKFFTIFHCENIKRIIFFNGWLNTQIKLEFSLDLHFLVLMLMINPMFNRIVVQRLGETVVFTACVYVWPQVSVSDNT